MESILKERKTQIANQISRNEQESDRNPDAENDIIENKSKPSSVSPISGKAAQNQHNENTKINNEK